MAVVGEFGSGKTYTLRYIETLLGTIDISPNAEEILAVYLERPDVSVLKTLGTICESIGRSRFKNLLLEFIFAEIAVALSEREEQGNAGELRKAIESSISPSLFSGSDPVFEVLSAPDAAMNPAATLDALVRGPLSTDVLMPFAAKTVSAILARRRLRDELAYHLAQFALSPLGDDAHAWRSLFEGKVLRGRRGVASIEAPDLWCHLLSILRHGGYSMVYWLLDEFEELEYFLEARPGLVQEFLAVFRDLIDASQVGFSVVLSVKLHAWQRFRELHPQFVQRVSRVVVLRKAGTQDLARMIKHRLALSRRNKERAQSELSPFSERAIKELFLTSKGNVRAAVEACHVLLWHAAKEDLEEISETQVQDLAKINRSFHHARFASLAEER